MSRPTLNLFILLALVLATSTSATARRPRKTAAPAPAASGQRRLSDVHIEGELSVPQVTFITAREPRRFFDFHHASYVTSSHQLGERTLYPSWIVPIQSADTTRKEMPR